MVGKKIKGRKRHISVDILGDLLHIKVHAANIHDTKSGCNIFKETSDKYPSILAFSADEGYRGTSKDYVQDTLTTRVLLLSKTYINPLVEFQFIINDNLKTIKSSATYIVKDDKYYQSLVDSQNARYKNMDIVGCIQNNDYYLVEAYLKTGVSANKKFLGLPLLHHAMEVGNPKTIDILLKSSANPNQGYLGQHPLSRAITLKQSK